MLDLSADAGAEDPTAVLLSWPPGNVGLTHRSAGYIVMRRPGGFLIVVPDGVMEASTLERHSAEGSQGEALVGPHTIIPTTLTTAAESGEPVMLPEEYQVMVVDMSLPGAGNFVQAFPEERTRIWILSISSWVGIPTPLPTSASSCPRSTVGYQPKWEKEWPTTLQTKSQRWERGLRRQEGELREVLCPPILCSQEEERLGSQEKQLRRNPRWLTWHSSWIRCWVFFP